LRVHEHEHQLYLLEQHSKSFTRWSAIIRINIVGNSLIMKSNPAQAHLVNISLNSNKQPVNTFKF